jgi:hypothetical protein
MPVVALGFGESPETKVFVVNVVSCVLIAPTFDPPTSALAKAPLELE